MLFRNSKGEMCKCVCERERQRERERENKNADRDRQTDTAVCLLLVLFKICTFSRIASQECFLIVPVNFRTIL